VGGVIGVAILGTFVGNQQTFLSGMHLAFATAGGVLVLALVSAWVFVRTREETPPKLMPLGSPGGPRDQRK
jgi:hypothetical protein